MTELCFWSSFILFLIGLFLAIICIASEEYEIGIFFIVYSLLGLYLMAQTYEYHTRDSTIPPILEIGLKELQI